MSEFVGEPLRVVWESDRLTDGSMRATKVVARPDTMSEAPLSD